jgi:hypothetical protein
VLRYSEIRDFRHRGTPGKLDVLEERHFMSDILRVIADAARDW